MIKFSDLSGFCIIKIQIFKDHYFKIQKYINKLIKYQIVNLK